jgi:hypothetical protein
MTTGQSPFSGNNRARPKEVLMVALPIVTMLLAFPFTKQGGTQVWLGQALAAGFGAAALGLVLLFVFFLVAHPLGWTRRRGVALAETITLWLAAGITVAHTL